ncbi:MAG: class I SAM-dependent methyltransferase [Desulfovibrio sp.]|jgi:SAM-dependent methyltransferase
MKHWKNPLDYSWPVIVENQDLRRTIPDIEAFFETARREAEALPRDGNVVRDEKLVVMSPCPICGSEDTPAAFVKYGFIYADCRECGHLFVKNRLREDVLLGLYQASKTDKIDRKVKTSAPHLDYWGQIYEKYLGLVGTLGIADPNVLDVGCGAGTFLKSVRAMTGLVPHGLDFCEDTFEEIVALTGRENYYYRLRMEDVDFGAKRFGLVTLWGVLEHLVDPVSVLSRCAEVLSPDGRVLLLIPNAHSRAIRILGVQTPTLHPRGHINLCTDKSFDLLCKKAGLVIERRFQELPVIDLMHPFIPYSEAFVREIVEGNEAYYNVYLLRRG